MKTINVFESLRLTLLCAAIASCVLPFRTAQAAQFIPLGYEQFAEAVSGDGLFAVGWGTRSSSQARRWSTSSGESLSLGCLPGSSCFGNAASTSGSVVVGSFSSFEGNKPFIWTNGGGMQPLGNSPGSATDVSADGAIVIGGHSNASGHGEAFRWTEGGGMVGLGTLPGGPISYSDATGVSADGLAVVGRSVGPNGYEAYLWTEGGGMQGLGVLPGDPFSEAHGISADGSTVVGASGSGSEAQAYRWTADTGMLGLGHLPGLNKSWAEAVSGDGSVVVGHGEGNSEEAFIWDETHGMRRLKDVLTAAGLDLTGWRLRFATGVSDDGNVIAGWGFNPAGQEEGWIARLNVVPEPTTFALLIAGSLLVSLRLRQSE